MLPSLAKRNVAVLAACQAVQFSIQSLLISIGPLVGFSLASNKAWATLPVTMVVVGTAISTIPASLIMGRIGRRPGFTIGALFGMTGAALATYAVSAGIFWLLCAGTLFFGLAAGFAQYYRFAAAEVVEENFRARAISLVMAGGVVAGFAGPQIAKASKDFFPEITFMGSYATVIGLALLIILLQGLVRIPRPTRLQLSEAQRPLLRIMTQPKFLVAVFNGMIGYGMMSLIMTATPLAMKHHHFQFGDSAMVIQWHVVAMFGPSFFTGSLIRRFGILTVLLSGAGLMVASLWSSLSGVHFVNFWLALVFLGLGWNFMFVGGTTLLTETYAPAERAKTQAANDFLVFATVATASLSSGQLLDGAGWQMVNLAAIPFLALAAGATLWLGIKERRRRAAV